MITFLTSLLIFFVALIHLDHYFFKKNQSFCIHHIYPDKCKIKKMIKTGSLAPNRKNFDLPSDQILNQPFHYLKRGHQSYVFESSDGKYVIKFYRFPSHLRRFSFFKDFFPTKQRKDVILYNLEKLSESFKSYQLAFEELKEESALLYIHLHPTGTFEKKMTLIDHLKTSYQVELDDLCFLLQKKADLLFPVLEQILAKGEKEEAKRLLSQIDQLILLRCSKGIADEDAILEKNYGWIDGKVIHIDVGRFVKKENLSADREVMKASHCLKSWLQQHE